MASEVDNWTWAAMAPELDPQEKALRDRFVEEFLVDGNAYLAALRVGFQAGFAKDYSAKFFNEPYVQQRLEHLKQNPGEAKQVEKYDKNLVMATLRTVATNQFEKGAARVAAAAKLAAIYGMDKPVEKKTTITHKGGVLMVPAIANLDDWEAIAKQSQEKLLADVRH